jgi:hypothetical protein
VALGFELRASRLLGKHSYPLSRNASSTLIIMKFPVCIEIELTTHIWLIPNVGDLKMVVWVREGFSVFKVILHIPVTTVSS